MDTRADAGADGGDQLAKQADQAAPERWEIDEASSRLSFGLRHLVFDRIEGEFERWGGTLFLDRRQPSLSSVKIWVELSSVDTDSSERDEHLRSAELFDVDQFPRATFTSTTVKVGEGEVMLHGRLDLHGAVRDIKISVTPIAMPTKATPGQRQTFAVTAKIDRQSFGLHWNQDLDVGGVVVGDDVELNAHVEVVLASP